MTNTAKAPEPMYRLGEIPVYKTRQAPAHLRSASQLRNGLRLRVAPGQRPVCYVEPWYHPSEPCALYDPADAVPPEDQSIGAAWAYFQRRTCPRCGQRREYIVRGHCGVCDRADRDKRRERDTRRCDGCRRIGEKPYPQVVEGWYAKRYCRACTAKKRRELAALLTTAIRCPVGCGKRTATKKLVLDWATQQHAAVARWTPRRCAPHETEHQAEQQRLEAGRKAAWAARQAEERTERARQREARRHEVADLAAWAAAVLADPDTVLLDTETTGLGEDARIVDIAVTTATGQVLLDTLVNPGEPIPARATAIHGITDAMVADAPSFAEILPRIAGAVGGKRVVIYNDSYDVKRLGWELAVLGEETGTSLYAAGANWLARHGARAEDAMIPYSDWVGEWDDYHGNNRWQRLGGGHRALGDCLAVIECLKTMAASRAGGEESAA